MISATRRSVLTGLCTCTCRPALYPKPSSKLVASSFASTSRIPLEYESLSRQTTSKRHRSPPTFESLARITDAATTSPSTAQDARSAERPYSSFTASSVLDLPVSPPSSSQGRTNPRLRRRDKNAAVISPYLPLVTRERSHLLSSLHSAVRQRSPAKTWAAFVKILQYPNSLPTLPNTNYHTSIKIAKSEYEPIEDPRAPLKLSLKELKLVFKVLASSRPFTFQGLTKLLVVAELINKNFDNPSSSSPVSESIVDKGRDTLLKPLRNNGRGLSQRELRTLMLFAGRAIRSPRSTIEFENVLTLFGHLKAPIEIETWNVLMGLAKEARVWNVYDNAKHQLKVTSTEGDKYTTGIELMMMLKRGVGLDQIWNQFVEAVRKVGPQQDRISWGAFLWILSQRGEMDDVMKIYEAMKVGRDIDLNSLTPMSIETAPQPEMPMVIPPLPDRAIFEALIQSHCYHGDLGAALTIMRDMMKSSPPTPPSHQVYTSLFRGFTRHASIIKGLSPRHMKGGEVTRVKANADARHRTPLSALTRLDPTSGPASPRSSASTEWSFEALGSLFEAFIATPPSGPLSSTTNLFEGERSSPQARQLFWLILAFEILTGNDSRAVLEMWNKVEMTFGTTGTKNKWKGWRLDGAVCKKLEEHRRKVIELERLEQEVNERVA